MSILLVGRFPFFVYLLTVLQLHAFYSSEGRWECPQTTDCQGLLDNSQSDPCEGVWNCGDPIDNYGEENAGIIYTIHNTLLNQPAVTLFFAKSGDYWDIAHEHYGVGVYAVGYRSCTTDPEKVCYISNELPYIDGFNSDLRNITTYASTLDGGMNHTLKVGDQCTFFGCFKYCSQTNGVCTRKLGNLSEQNITILAKCSNAPDGIKNGYVKYSQNPTPQGHYPEHTTATITCDEGYRLSGNNITTCQNDGNWSSLLSSCEIVDCVSLPIPSHPGIRTSILLQNTTTFNSNVTVMYECEEGYLPPANMSGNITVSHTCTSDGTWSDNVTIECIIVDCGPLPNQSDPHVIQTIISPESSTTYNSTYNSTVTVMYGCEEGYQLPGNKPGNITVSHTCTSDRTWSDNVTIKCTIVNCGPWPVPSDHHIWTSISPQHTTTFNSNVTVMYGCEEGYLLPANTPGNITVSHTCTSDGTWSDDMTFKCLECDQVASCGEGEECKVINGTAKCLPQICSFEDCHLLKLIGLLPVFGLLLVVAIVCTTIIYRQCQNYRNNQVRKYRHIFQWQARNEVLDPTYTPIDVRPHRNIYVTLSLGELSKYEEVINSPSALSAMSEDPYNTKIPVLDGLVEIPETDMKFDTKIENGGRTSEKETVIDAAVDAGLPIENEPSTVSLSPHLTDTTGAYVYNSEQAFETEVVDYIESTEMEVPSSSYELPVKACLNDTCSTADEVETAQMSSYINDCQNSAQEESNDIEFSTASHDSPTDVSLAFELVNGVVYTPATHHSSSSGYVCDSSESTPLPESRESTPSPEILTALPSPEIDIAIGPPEVNNVISRPEQSEEEATPYVSSELFQCHNYPPPKYWSSDHSTSTSSGYLSEDLMKSHFTPPNNSEIVSHQSCLHGTSPSQSYKIQDLGGGYVDVSNDETL